MPGLESLNKEIIVTPTCPFLGLEDDAGTSQAFPSIWNICHRCLPIAPPNFKHQREYCLNANHRTCLVYLRPYNTEPMPLHLRAPGNRPNRPRYIPWGRFAITSAVVVALFILGWGVLNQRVLSFEIGKAAEPVFDSGASIMTPPPPAAKTSSASTVKNTAALPDPSASVTVTHFTTNTLTSTVSLFSGRTATSVNRKHQLDVPIGTDRKFVIHKVVDGESLELYASRYDTSREAILALSFNKEVPVWVDSLVVIPLGFTNVAGLPAFVVYRVKEEERGISTEALAKRLKVDLQDFKYYNGVTDDGDRPLVGDYFLIPRPRPAP